MDLDRHFEGRARLQALLDQAGVLADVDDIAQAFVKAQADQVPHQVVIEALFEDEPIFSSPKEARALYGNLLGLWDLLGTGASVDLARPPEKKPRVKAAPLPRPGAFGRDGPGPEWVELAWRYFDDAPDKERTRWLHAFENRQDALLSWLDEGGLTDAGFATARSLLFELHAMLELGWPAGLKSVDVVEAAFSGEAVPPVPPALSAWAEEAIFEAEQDEEAPLTPDEAQRVRRLVDRALAGLFRARRSQKE